MTKTAHRGFTLIEILCVIAITSLFVAIAAPSYGLLRNNVTLENETRELVDAMRTAQSRAITAQDGAAQHGVHFNTSDYVLFAGAWPTTGTTYSLGGSVQIVGGAGTEVLFDKLTGKTGGATIVIGYPSGQQRSIIVDTTGAINIF